LLNAPGASEISALSLHDALPILVWELWNVLTQLAATTLIAYLIIRWPARWQLLFSVGLLVLIECLYRFVTAPGFEQPFVKGENRSEEHTSELQSRENLVCRLLLE